jgi:hypothetical protein
MCTIIKLLVTLYEWKSFSPMLGVFENLTARERGAVPRDWRKLLNGGGLRNFCCSPYVRFMKEDEMSRACSAHGK